MSCRNGCGRSRGSRRGTSSRSRSGSTSSSRGSSSKLTIPHESVRLLPGRHIEAAGGQCRDIVANLHQGACRAEMAAEGVGVVVGVRVAGVGVGVLVVAGVVAAS